MTKVASVMPALGHVAPDFALPDPREDNRIVHLSDLARNAKAVLVVFLANHCPYSKHILHKLAKMIRQYQEKGLCAVGISTSDIEDYPEDGPDHMRHIAESLSFTFPFLFDESQNTAKAYQAACTPDFFLFDARLRLVYRGRFDASLPGNGVPVTGEDLEHAISAVLDGRPVPQDQKPSLGCSIKWKSGQKPVYAP